MLLLFETMEFPSCEMFCLLKGASMQFMVVFCRQKMGDNVLNPTRDTGYNEQMLVSPIQTMGFVVHRVERRAVKLTLIPLFGFVDTSCYLNIR